MYNFKEAAAAILILAISACDHSSATNELTSDQHYEDMHCAPQEVSASTPITITLPRSHGNAMAVQKPDHEFLIFSWDVTEDINRNKSPIYNIVNSKNDDILLLYNIEAYDYKTYELRQVFDTPGEYIILLGSTPDLLDTLWEFSCTVYFSGKI